MKRTYATFTFGRIYMDGYDDLFDFGDLKFADSDRKIQDEVNRVTGAKKMSTASENTRKAWEIAGKLREGAPVNDDEREWLLNFQAKCPVNHSNPGANADKDQCANCAMGLG